ncbi:MAG: type II toxin-antitoxin system HicB family antitoxin [Azoarcus sp.]|jgi:antitoxin HicB|nr:type II toxin-antitoxin system HicB family antitoxin [Azoarcus sp.]
MENNIEYIQRVEGKYPFDAYAYIISPIPADEGGGFLLTIPDLPGCMADGETEAEAITNGRDAFSATVSALIHMGREIPAPKFSPERLAVPDVSGKFVARLPKTIHARLVERAAAEGVSLNSLIISMVSEGLGFREAHGTP